jgi:hypothetical protein
MTSVAMIRTSDDRHPLFAFSTLTGERSTFNAWYDTEDAR